ncbi:UDP-glucuronosyltransferase 3A1-like [Scaptodrosophila lebanonensis]|uniref:UDP-glucuronosyltransferase n=1 Tax=Drosophila lebanonensis TaxID=7225 RepID=A0A6J2U6X2_DROLE|nr:UDP-glucuronosyltransferase 3A1-like [Scaptodrosophila lebanonensis]
MVRSSRFLFLRLLVLGLTLASVNSLRILGLFPYRAMSHFQVTLPLTRGLAAAGHNVDVLSPFPDHRPPPRYTDYALPGESYYNVYDLHIFENRNFLLPLLEFFNLFSFGVDSCNQTLSSQALAKILTRPTGYYDVIIMEQFHTDCLMGVAYQLKSPVIALTSSALMPWHYERMGVPIIPSFIPNFFLGHSHEMSIWGRVSNWITIHFLKLLYKPFNTLAADEMLRKRFEDPNMPSTADLVKYTSLFFVNQHYSFSGPKPLPPNVIEVGGIHLQRSRPLPPYLEHMLNEAEHGVVIISWGSLIRTSTMPPAKLSGILSAIARCEQQFIWKWENDTLPNKPDNLHIVKWLPQQDILCHPNVRAFMSHGGMMGTNEAVHCAVPVLGTPIYGDQFLNIAALVQRGMAVRVDYDDISEKTIYNALQEVLKEKYRIHAKHVALSFNERPQTPVETAIWWVEHVAKTGGVLLTQPSSVHMSRFVYYSLDVYLVFIVTVLLLVAACYGILRQLCRLKRYIFAQIKFKQL